MSKFYLWLGLFIIFTAIASSLPDEGIDSVPPIRKQPIREEQAPPLKDISPEGQGKLREKSRSDRTFQITVQEKEKGTISTGTAFSLSEDGIWVTARHVTSGCTKLAVLKTARKGYRVNEVIEHPTADVSILKTSFGAKPFTLNHEDLEYNTEGFHFGYPRGEPGNVYSRLIGRRIMKTRGAKNDKESVLVWAEKVRQPDNDLSLGGISGGPVVNKEGHIVGVHVAGSIRRGRSYTSLPEKVTQLLQNTDYSVGEPITAPDGRYHLDNLKKTGMELRKQLSVAKVLCFVK